MCPAFHMFGASVYLFPLFFMVAGNAAVLLYYYSPRYPDNHRQLFLKAVTYGLVLAIVGGKCLSAVTLAFQGRNFPESLWKGGFVFYGGLLGGCVGLGIFCRKYEQNFLDWADIFGSLLPLCQAIGRIGCFFNGCCYGKPYEGVGSVRYPVDGVWMRVYPTWFMESLGCGILFVWLWNRPDRSRRGILVRDYMLGYGSLRFCVECFRGDQIRGVWGILSTSQMISICLILAGLGIGRFIRRNKEQNAIW